MEQAHVGVDGQKGGSPLLPPFAYMLWTDKWLKKTHPWLANFLRTYQNVPHTSTGHSPAEMIFGRMPHTHLSMLLPSTSERV